MALSTPAHRNQALIDQRVKLGGKSVFNVLELVRVALLHPFPVSGLFGNGLNDFILGRDLMAGDVLSGRYGVHRSARGIEHPLERFR